MIEYKILLGILSVLVGIAAYIVYFRNILSGKTKPHAFSWLVWGILTGIAFAAQISQGAGPGAWVTGSSAILCAVIFLLALSKGERDFPLIDWLFLAGAGLALAWWIFTKDPTGSVILVIITDALAFVPSFRKAYSRPYEETALTFALNGLKFLIALFAMSAISLATALYPAYLVIANASYVTLILVRRRQ